MLSVIKCLFNYDNAIIIKLYKMQEKFINQSKIFLIVSLACFIFWIIYLPTNIVISVFTFYTWLKFTNHINQIIYIRMFRPFRGGARILVWGGISEKISYMNSSQVLYCNGVAKISVRGGTFSTMYSSKTFWKVLKNLHKNLKNSPKFFKNKI